MVEFRGLRPWPQEIEVIEAERDGVVVDLHNDATLVEARISCTPDVELVMVFRTTGGRQARLAFSAVTGLSFVQDPADGATPSAGSWRPDDVETFYGVQFRAIGEDRGEFDVETITGTFRFTAATVSFDLSDEPG